LTRQISVHTGKFLENFRKHGRAVPAPSRSPHRLARWAERRTRMTRMRDKKAFPPSRVACSCVWSTDAVRVCTRWCVRLVTGDRRVCVSVRVYTNGSDTHYICSLAALRQANFGKFSRAARAGKFSFKFSKTQVCPNKKPTRAGIMDESWPGRRPEPGGMSEGEYKNTVLRCTCTLQLY
jgi:hypothetical protein